MKTVVVTKICTDLKNRVWFIIGYGVVVSVTDCNLKGAEFDLRVRARGQTNLLAFFALLK
jgi:hypothetical protein